MRITDSGGNILYRIINRLRVCYSKNLHHKYEVRTRRLDEELYFQVPETNEGKLSRRSMRLSAPELLSVGLWLGWKGGGWSAVGGIDGVTGGENGGESGICDK